MNSINNCYLPSPYSDFNLTKPPSTLPTSPPLQGEAIGECGALWITLSWQQNVSGWEIIAALHWAWISIIRYVDPNDGWCLFYGGINRDKLVSVLQNRHLRNTGQVFVSRLKFAAWSLSVHWIKRWILSTVKAEISSLSWGDGWNPPVLHGLDSVGLVSSRLDCFFSLSFRLILEVPPENERQQISVLQRH